MPTFSIPDPTDVAKVEYFIMVVDKQNQSSSLVSLHINAGQETQQLLPKTLESSGSTDWILIARAVRSKSFLEYHKNVIFRNQPSVKQSVARMCDNPLDIVLSLLGRLSITNSDFFFLQKETQLGFLSWYQHKKQI